MALRWQASERQEGFWRATAAVCDVAKQQQQQQQEKQEAQGPAGHPSPPRHRPQSAGQKVAPVVASAGQAGQLAKASDAVLFLQALEACLPQARCCGQRWAAPSAGRRLVQQDARTCRQDWRDASDRHRGCAGVAGGSWPPESGAPVFCCALLLLALPASRLAALFVCARQRREGVTGRHLSPLLPRPVPRHGRVTLY